MTKDIKYTDQLQELYETYTGKELESVLGVTVRSIQNYLKPDNPTIPGKEVIQKIREVFANHKDGKPLGNTDGSIVNADYSARALFNLTESNRLIAESNASLAASNKELVLMVKGKSPTENALKETTQVVAASLHGLREFVLEQFVKRHKFQSYEEADTVLNRKIGESLRKMKQDDTQID